MFCSHRNSPYTRKGEFVIRFRRRKASHVIIIAASAAVVGWGVSVAPNAIAGANGAPTPPYTQCPAIGASPSCEILLVVNPDGSVSVDGDPSVGPFDGGDDTLVGIVNDSNIDVKAVTVSGPGSGLSEFDGDGICSGDYGTWNGSSGCPYGPTGYEGPGTSFVTSPSLPDSAEVDFTGGLAPGASRYFSLEGALTSAQLTARQGPLTGRYVALGDSYSSGEGNPPFISPTDTSLDKCHRSGQAYGPLVQAFLNIPASDFTFSACSGAVMADLVANLSDADGQYTEGRQLDEIASLGQPSLSTGLITLSIGGNDAGFPFILQACISGFAHTAGQSGCLAAMTTDIQKGTRLLENGGTILLDMTNNNYQFCDQTCVTIWSNIDKEISGERYQVVTVPSLAGLYEDIHQRAPQADIRVLQYPHLYPASPPAQCTVGTISTFFHTFDYDINRTEMIAANNAADTLDAVIAKEVSAAQAQGLNIQAVDARPDFANHEICSSAPWINGLILNGLSPSPYSFHPNAAGQADFAKLFEAGL